MTRMTKMTKAEAVKMLKNRKVYVAGKSAEIQKKLFWLGLKWCDDDDTNISYVDRPFLYIYRDQIAWGENMVDFVESEFKEISAEEILSIDVDEGYEFEHLERVLVRDSEDNTWIPEFFLKKLDSRTYSFKCAYSTWNFCIPYKGNEHLVGTANSPKDKEE